MTLIDTITIYRKGHGLQFPLNSGQDTSLYICIIFWMLNGRAHCRDISKEKLSIPSTKHLNHKAIKEASVIWWKKLAPETESYLKNKRTAKESIGIIDRGFVGFGCHDHRLYNNLVDLFMFSLHTQYTVLRFLWTPFQDSQTSFSSKRLSVKASEGRQYF